jgi:hypothetical protein
LECLYRLKFDFGRTREQRLMGYMDILAATPNFCQRGGLVLISTPEQRLKKQKPRLKDQMNAILARSRAQQVA